jgi:TetR/AcrR family transcriptional regulator, regulator of autoinduction and epiphytic fitness
MKAQTRRNERSARRPRRAPASRAETKAATQRRILAEALKLFQRRGFEATTTKQIARAARIAEGTIFNYFRSKEEIALFFFEEEVDHAIAAVKANKRLAKATLDEKLFALLQYQFEYLEKHERFIWAVLLEALRPGSPLTFSAQALGIRARYLAFVEALIDESLGRTRRSAMQFWAAQAFWIYYMGVLLYWINDHSRGKQNTLAFVDRTLKLGVNVLLPRA